MAENIHKLIERAIESGNLPYLEKLLKQNPQPQWLENQKDYWVYGGSVLHFAASRDQPEIVRFLVETKKMRVNLQIQCSYPDYPGYNLMTPLYVASTHGAREAAAMLLKLGANPALKNGEERDAVAFCQSERMLELLDPAAYQLKQEQKKALQRQQDELARQEKITGTWARNTPQEIAHIHELPEGGLQLTDIFNFETRCLRSVVKNLDGGNVAQNIVFFDDMPDTEIAHQACRKLNELGGEADEDGIDNKLMRGKQFKR